MALPFMFYAQAVRGYSPTRAALLLVPMALLSGGLAPVVGRFVDNVHPRGIATFGLTACAVALAWMGLIMTPDTSTWELLLPIALLGIANAFMWAPLGVTATRNLPMRAAGAGAGVYNTTRQVGAVLGSAAIAAIIEARLRANLPGISLDTGDAAAGGGALPPAIRDGFSSAMGQSMLLPAGALLIGLLAALFFQRHSGAPEVRADASAAPPEAVPV
jgi:hypothetical protein